jgi:hypothetical protein
MEEKKEIALRLCQKIGAATMFTDFNDGMSLPLEISKKIAIAAINYLRPDMEYWQDVINEIKNL